MTEPIKTIIFVKAQFEAIHSWPNCPHIDVAFLCCPHRHVFHVKLKLHVSHDDREHEFIRVKRTLEGHLRFNYEGSDLGSKSCEMIAKEIGIYFNQNVGKVHSVSVSEDNENGAEVYYE